MRVRVRWVAVAAVWCSQGREGLWGWECQKRGDKHEGKEGERGEAEKRRKGNKVLSCAVMRRSVRVTVLLA